MPLIETIAPPRWAFPTPTSFPPRFRWDVPSPFSGSAIYESPEAREIMHRSGLTNLDRLFSLTRYSVHGHRGRAVIPMALPGAVKAVPSFIKLNWGRRRVWPRMTDLKSGQFLKSFPHREWLGIERLREIGVQVPERIALLRHGVLRFREAVVLKEVPPRYSLHDLFANGGWERLSGELQQELLATVAKTLAKIHEAGLAWRGVCTRHFFPAQEADESWKVWLIDCEGVHRSRAEKDRRRDHRKMMKAMNCSAADSATTEQMAHLLQACQPTQ